MSKKLKFVVLVGCDTAPSREQGEEIAAAIADILQSNHDCVGLTEAMDSAPELGNTIRVYCDGMTETDPKGKLCS